MTTPYAPYIPPMREGRGWQVAPIQISFSLSITPMVSPSAGSRENAVEMVSVTPAFTMEEVGHSLADFALTVMPTIGMDDPFGAVTLTVAPAVAFAQAEHYSVNSSLDITIGFGFDTVGPVWVAALPLTVTPAFAFTGTLGLAMQSKNVVISQAVRRSSLY